VRDLPDGRYMVNTEDLGPFMQQSDETLLARVEALEQEIEDLERRIETLEHIFLTASEPAGKRRRLNRKLLPT
jgi:chaperonin cofactor prefoldin